ncbi:hypothetical protein EVAR_14511_1 [Eumeta japonica]|uniref:Uncharacterized protein n=1 Tax=Eumeta variegata TaxID=151549 RepID=A0A4C1U333_EUMVA|nr:hypothetical protein EVAR_14511_1 [Eumeta japonica]
MVNGLVPSACNLVSHITRGTTDVLCVLTQSVKNADGHAPGACQTLRTEALPSPPIIYLILGFTVCRILRVLCSDHYIRQGKHSCPISEGSANKRVPYPRRTSFLIDVSDSTFYTPQRTKLPSDLSANDVRRRFNALRLFLLLPRFPILRHCDVFATNFTAAEIGHLACNRFECDERLKSQFSTSTAVLHAHRDCCRLFLAIP